MQWEPAGFIKCGAASSAKLPCTLQRWNISFKGRQAVTADRLCFYREDTFKGNKTLGNPGGRPSGRGIGKSAVHVGSFPLPAPKFGFRDCRTAVSRFEEVFLFKALFLFPMRNPRVGFAFRDGAEGNGRASGCTARLQRLSAGRMAAAVRTPPPPPPRTPPGFRWSLPL